MRKPSHILSLVLIFCTLLSSHTLLATHNRAGEITYQHLGGLRYRVTIVTYTKISAPADRDSLAINWGDGSALQSIPRNEANDALYGNRDIRRNTYSATHTYSGAGNYKLSFEDPNRNNDILNLKPPNGQSDQVTFYIESTLIINPFAPPSVGQNNSSVILLNPPIDLACFGQTYIHNPGAFDPEGDSLAYKLVPSRIAGGIIPDFYVFPDQISPGPNNDISIDPITGDLVWETPQRIGEYNVAILIQEYREGILVGEILRDMQIEVRGCNNRPPVIVNNAAECVIAGDIFQSEVTATDPDGDDVTLTAVGELFLLTPNTATFTQNTVNPAVAELNWLTFCDNIRLRPYSTSIKAEDDNAQTPLVDFGSQDVFVIGPSVKNLSIVNNDNNIQIDWTPYQCDNAVGYKIYRKLGFSGYIPSGCETGVPATTGYQLYFTSIDPNLISFTDNDVQESQEYCYIVTACFADGAESIASEEICTEIGADRPYFNKVSVGNTDAVNGIDSISWRTPIDTVDLKSRFTTFRYEIFQIDDQGNANSILSTGPSINFSDLDTTLILTNLNTIDALREYTLSFYTDGILYSESKAQSLHLSTTVVDATIQLTWNSDNPWSDTLYDIYKKRPNDVDFFFLNNTFGSTYSDKNLINGEEYCYYIVEHAKYINPLADQNILNYSQVICDIPEDKTPPCKSTIEAFADCKTRRVEIEFTDSAATCASDVFQYYLYFSSEMNGTYSKVDSADAGNTSFSYTNDTDGISGCYFVTSIDFNGNESDSSNVFCANDCDGYTLPNVFTPNGDGVNDVFRPFPFNGIQSAEIKIFNRWGKLVFETTDPAILWDGTYMGKGKNVGEGIFYYVVKVLQNTIEGAQVKELQGDFSLIRD